MLPSPSHRPRARLGPLLAALLGLVVGLLPGLTGPTAAAAAESRAHTLAAGTFRNPLNSGPDPFMTHWKGAYYLTTTQGGSIRMWRSPSLGTLLTADPVTVWTDTDPSRNRNIWAPEFYRFGDRWYLYYTADDGVDDHHRLYVLESERDDPTGPYHFTAKLAPPNHADDFAIDAGILQLGAGSTSPTAASTSTSTTGSTSPRCPTLTPSPGTRWRSTRRAAAPRCARGPSSSTGAGESG